MANLTVTKKQLAVIAGVVALAAAGVGVGLATTSGPTCPPLSTLAGGGTFQATGCSYDVGAAGLTITKPTSITGGTFTATTVDKGRPIIEVNGTSANLTGLTIAGTNTALHIVYGAKQAGIKLIATTNTTITDTNISDTGGDCLEVFAEPGSHFVPNTNVTVNGGVYTKCGRDGISPSDVADSTFSNIDIVSKGQSGIDAESDIGSGMGNVAFNDNVIPGIVIIERIKGPIAFNNNTITGRLQYRARAPQLFPVTVTGGTFAAGAKAAPVIIWQDGTGPASPLSFVGVTFSRPFGNKGAALWSATDNSVMVFTHSFLPPPFGTNDSTSTVTITP